MFDAAETNRRIENLLCYASVAEVDDAGRKLRLDIAGRRTGWLPYPAEIGANFRRWRPLRIGTQVVAGCISGDPANAVVLAILYTDALSPPGADETLDTVVFDDGTALSYDSAAHKLAVSAAGDIAVTAAKDMTASVSGKLVVRAAGGIEIAGDIELSGKLNATGDVTARGISLSSHTHSGVKAGSDTSGKPQ